jgi:hypothetical protein
MWTCRICDHPMREMIDHALVQGDKPGQHIVYARAE